MNPDRREMGEDKPSLEDKLEYVRQLISNQYGIVHHTERYIFDIAKMASIVLAAISFVGIPQLLSYDSPNLLLVAFSRGLAAGLITYALSCIVVIVQAIWSIGGLNLNLKPGFNPSLWWYSDSRLANLKGKDLELDQESMLQVFTEIREKVEKKPDGVTFTDECMTYSMLVLRAEVQLKVAKRMKLILVSGLFFSLGTSVSGILSAFL